MLSLNCPPVVKLYAQYMGGVDRSDRMVRTYFVSRQVRNGGFVSSTTFQTWRWQIVLFFIITRRTMMNSVNWRRSKNCLSLIATFSKDEKVQSGPERKRTMIPAIPRLITGNHWPLKTKQRRECQQCKRKGRQGRRTFYTCESCGIHLCIDVCFKRYHTRR